MEDKIFFVKDNFLSVYRKDYVKKPFTKLILKGKSQEFNDPINEGYKNFLKLTDEDLKEPEEQVDEYFKKFKELYPETAQRYFENPLDKEVVEKSFLKNGRTVYQVDYCDLEKDKEFNEELERKRHVKLPDDWIIPDTTYLNSYRNPTLFKKNALERKTYGKQPDNLGSKEHIFKILKVTTGDSEYQGEIGKLGGYIVQQQLHGKIIHPKCTCIQHNIQEENVQ